MAARSFLGAGDVYIDRIVNGTNQGLVGPIYADQFSIQPSVEVKQTTSKGRYDYGQVLESVNLNQPATFTIALKEATLDTLTMAFLGTSAALTEGSGTMSAQVVSMPKKGVWVETGNLRLGSSITVTGPTGAGRTGTYADDVGNTGDFTSGAVTVADNTAVGVYTGTFSSATAYSVTAPGGAVVGSGSTGSAFSAGGLGFTITAGSTPAVNGDTFTITVAAASAGSTLVEGTDYKLNRPLGMIQIMEDSAFVAPGDVSISGTYAGATGNRISGATLAEVRCRIIFDGINKADGSEATVDVYEAILSAESEFDFLADDFGNVTLTGTLKTPVGKGEPFVVDLKGV